MKKHTTITLSKEDCDALARVYNILSTIENAKNSGAYWTTNDILAIIRTARGENLPTGLNAMKSNESITIEMEG